LCDAAGVLYRSIRPALPVRSPMHSRLFMHYRLCSLREPTRQVLRQSELMRAGRDEAMCGTAFMLVGCLYGWKVPVY
ncbi:unnamed protein product, partial [Peniophora sp. CBMAI 1063]